MCLFVRDRGLERPKERDEIEAEMREKEKENHEKALAVCTADLEKGGVKSPSRDEHAEIESGDVEKKEVKEGGKGTSVDRISAI